jgi:hypothetical protein
MFERMKDKLPGMKGKEMPEEEMKKKKPMAGIEIEIEGEEEGMEGEEAPEGMEEEEVSVGKLAELSDEELMAEVEKRGMTVSKPEEGEGKEMASGGSSIMALPEVEEEEEEEVPVPPKKKKA